MKQREKIKVLVVDDSLVFRELLSRGISTDPLIEVVAKAADPFEARDKILEFHPDIMICDIQMPKMNGIEFLRRLLPQYSIPVIVVSSLCTAVFDALHAGAVDFIPKPAGHLNHVESFIEELIEKVKAASSAKIVSHSMQIAEKTKGLYTGNHIELIAIGASTGGTGAIYSLLESLPPDIPGIVIVQHIPPVFSGMFAQRLNQALPFQVKEAQTGDLIERGSVFIAPGDRHLRVKKVGGSLKLECYYGEKVGGHCPSVDVLFDSVAKEAGSRSIGIVLTGMGSDGANGLLSMRLKGARTIGQDEKSSVVYGMPKAAYEMGAVEKQSSLSNIPRVLSAML